MRLVSFIQPCNDKAEIPELFQSTLKFQSDGSDDGNGLFDTSLLGPVAVGSSAAYGGTVKNDGCCWLELFITFMAVDCDNGCGVDGVPETEQKTVKVAPNTELKLPDAYIVHMSARTIEEDGTPKEVESEQCVTFEGCTTDPLDVPEYSEITFWKCADVLGYEAGDTIVYTFEVQNNGNVPVTAVTIDDPTLGIAGAVPTPVPIPPGETSTYVFNYTITVADEANGIVFNSATVNGTGQTSPATSHIEESCDPKAATGSSPIVAKINLLSFLGGEACPIDFAASTFDMTAYGGTAADAFADAAQLVAAVDAATGFTWAYDEAGCELETSDTGATSNQITVTFPTTDISIGKSVDNPNPAEGAFVTFTLAVNAPTGAGNMVINDLLPAGLTFINASTGGYDPVTGVWNRGTVGPAFNEFLQITAQVDAGTSGQTLTNTATISSDETDTNPADNSSSVSITVS